MWVGALMVKKSGTATRKIGPKPRDCIWPSWFLRKDSSEFREITRCSTVVLSGNHGAVFANSILKTLQNLAQGAREV